MIRTYVTTIPLQGRFDLAVNQYQSPDNAETLQTRFPIIQVIKNTVTSEDELKIFAIRCILFEIVQKLFCFAVKKVARII